MTGRAITQGRRALGVMGDDGAVGVLGGAGNGVCPLVGVAVTGRRASLGVARSSVRGAEAIVVAGSCGRPARASPKTNVMPR